jgi:DNA-binding MarR family transcriptional regulator
MSTELAADPLSKQRLRLWVRLLGVTRTAEGHMREFLRLNHQTTLPRFDVMAALQRRGARTTMSEISRMLLVSNGNVTAVVDRLEADGLVRRSADGNDRRTVYVALTPKGARQFERLAADHEREVNQLFGSLSAAEIDTLTVILKRLRKGAVS